MPTIPAWSASALNSFEECPRRLELQRILRVPELPRPEPPNGVEHANDRGSRIHDETEQYIRGTQPLGKEMGEFRDELEHLQAFYKAGKVVLEDMWCFNHAWQPVGSRDFRNIWVRIKLDAFVFLTPTIGLVVDYKTGKKFGNEIKHAQQCQLYQLAAFMRYPQLEHVYTELWYPDVKELTRMGFTRNQGEKFFKGFNERGIKMTSATEFPAKPSRTACMFCGYGPEESSNKWVNKNGACDVGV